jgi:hypothetical protein
MKRLVAQGYDYDATASAPDSDDPAPLTGLNIERIVAIAGTF